MSDLAKRALACTGWRWLPGMLSNWGRVLWAEESGYAFIWQQAVTLGRMPGDAVPDLADPATIGCLLWLVQQAGGDVPVHPDAESLVMALEACDD